MWVAVGASGGYLFAFISMIVAYCRRGKRRHNGNNNLYAPGNKF